MLLFFKNAREPWKRLDHFSGARDCLYLLLLNKEGHLSFTRSFPQLNNSETLCKKIHIQIYTHRDS